MRWIIVVIVILSVSGFRLLNPRTWRDVSREQPVIWLKLCEHKSFNFSNFDLPADDPLHGTTPEVDEILISIINDFNAVTTSYARLAEYGRDYTLPDGEKVSFEEHGSPERTINVCLAESDLSRGAATGEAQLYYEGDKVVGCGIAVSIQKGRLDLFVRDLGHEIGHCLGLDHPQETSDALMSYFADWSRSIRLQADDKSGLTYLFPSKPSHAQEYNTLGWSCQPHRPSTIGQPVGNLTGNLLADPTVAK